MRQGLDGIKKFPHPEEAAHGSRLRGGLEGRTMPIPPIVNFLTASLAREAACARVHEGWVGRVGQRSTRKEPEHELLWSATSAGAIGAMAIPLFFAVLPEIYSEPRLVYGGNPGPSTVRRAKEQRGAPLFLRCFCCFSLFFTAMQNRKGDAIIGHRFGTMFDQIYVSAILYHGNELLSIL